MESPNFFQVYNIELIRETKDTLNLDDLEWDEAMRIRFAKLHFDAAPDGSVIYNNTTDRDGLRFRSTVSE